MAWDIENPISELPESIASYFKEEAKKLRKELEYRKLNVVLVPAPVKNFESHCIRMADNWNPEWYSDMYNRIPNFKRKRCIGALERIMKKEDGKIKRRPFMYTYDMRMRALIYERLTEEYEAEGMIFEPVEEVKKYFENV